MWAHPGKQLLFMGGEFGQESEWSEERGLDWWILDNPDHRGLQTSIRDMNQVYVDNPALWSLDHESAGFAWIDADDVSNNVFSFLRMDGKGAAVACVSNFSAVPHYEYRIGLPSEGEWTEVLNTDAEIYGGSGVGNLGGVTAEGETWHGLPASASITLPPLATVWFANTG